MVTYTFLDAKRMFYMVDFKDHIDATTPAGYSASSIINSLAQSIGLRRVIRSGLKKFLLLN